ncbi:hypothetical protein CDCA_CDCA07G2118 [Cyanidium caldarium]|uniref:Mitochondrial carrier protein n=1 Tax=Cyanidium caldarium TaxID=2771 RepID=A0AAV9IVI5_CYACA|nr:hypothetical protein CDCA_CDCA07G2118 [Cyanidium caldarium]
MLRTLPGGDRLQPPDPQALPYRRLGPRPRSYWRGALGGHRRERGDGVLVCSVGGDSSHHPPRRVDHVLQESFASFRATLGERRALRKRARAEAEAALARRRAREAEEEARGSSLKSSVQLRSGGKEPSWKYLVSGALAGVVSRTVVSPLEVVATTSMSTVGATQNFLREMSAVFRREGIGGLFKGNVANCLKVAPMKGIQFVVFESFKQLIAFRRRHQRQLQKGGTLSDSEDVPLRAGERLIAGGLAGMAAAVICYPLEVSKTLLTAEPGRYRGVFGCLQTLVREKGIGALYRGLAPTMVAMFPYVGLEFMVYEQLKLAVMQRQMVAVASAELDRRGTMARPLPGKRVRPEQPNVWILLLLGAVAGTVAQTVCHPLDVIRKRLQLQGIGNRPIQYHSMLHVACEIIKNEGGVRALYKGLTPAATSVFPSAGVSYLVYEWLKNLLGATSL